MSEEGWVGDIAFQLFDEFNCVNLQSVEVKCVYGFDFVGFDLTNVRKWAVC